MDQRRARSRTVLHLLAIKTMASTERVVVHAPSAEAALATIRAQRPALAPEAVRVLRSSNGPTLTVPRGRPPSAARVAAKATWLKYEGERAAADIV